MNFSKEEKKALKTAAGWLRKVKKETSLPGRHAYHKKLTDSKRKKHEKIHGLSENQHDQKWIDKSKALQQKISKTRVNRPNASG